MRTCKKSLVCPKPNKTHIYYNPYLKGWICYNNRSTTSFAIGKNPIDAYTKFQDVLFLTRVVSSVG
jgi:hypothetical protein